MPILPVIVLALSCPANCVPHAGVCACDIKPQYVETVKPSDEKPPRHPQPEWERGEVNVISVPSLQDEDESILKEKRQADLEGKRAAGLID